jgi:hypothetical protein
MNNQNWSLFLDDEREPSSYLPHDIVVSRSFQEAVLLVQDFGVPELISFDHDLGSTNGVNHKSGKDFLIWLIDEHLDSRIDLGNVKEVIVHSANPVGAKNIAELWNGFCGSELNTEVKAILRPRTSNFKYKQK